MIRESVDFFRFDSSYEDVFITDSGALLYACADSVAGNPFATTCRLYEISEEEAESCSLLFDDVCGEYSMRGEWQCIDIWSLSEMRPASTDAAVEIIAAEYAALNYEENDKASFARLQDEARKAVGTCMSRAAYTYWGHLFADVA